MLSILSILLFWMFWIVISLFVIISIILFIRDGIRAKREGTGRKLGIIVMFTISMTIIALVVVCGILLYLLGMAIMSSM